MHVISKFWSLKSDQVENNSLVPRVFKVTTILASVLSGPQTWPVGNNKYEYKLSSSSSNKLSFHAYTCISRPTLFLFLPSPNLRLSQQFCLWLSFIQSFVGAAHTSLARSFCCFSVRLHLSQSSLAALHASRSPIVCVSIYSKYIV